MKKLIAITVPQILDDEHLLISSVLEKGIHRLHLRKPEASASEMRNILEKIPVCYHNRISLHDKFSLVEEFPNIGGLNLNRRNSDIPKGFNGQISRSCHSLEEIRNCSNMDYLFLSPIFNSISKEGYESGFTIEELESASDKGIINDKVFALGGIDEKTIPELHTISFGGVAVLGALWGNNPSIHNINELIKRLNDLMICLQQY